MKMNIPPTFKPAITGPWQLLFRPHKTGCYINDHTLLRGHDGNWHLFGITRDQSQVNPDHERYFVPGEGSLFRRDNALWVARITVDARRIEKPSKCQNDVKRWLRQRKGGMPIGQVLTSLSSGKLGRTMIPTKYHHPFLLLTSGSKKSHFN